MVDYGTTDSTNVIWRTWTVDSSSSTVISMNDIWPAWAGGTGTNGTAAGITAGGGMGNGADGTWYTWTGTGSGTGDVIWSTWTTFGGACSGVCRPAETEEQRLARLEQERVWQAQSILQQAEYQKKEEERRKKEEAADKRAEVLFTEIVGEEQFKLFKKRGYHEVVSPAGNRYRLRPRTIVDQMEGNFGEKVFQRMCIHHTYQNPLPPMDTLIHQMLMIQCGQEDEFQKTANKHRVAA